LSGQEHGYYVLNWLIHCLHSAALASVRAHSRAVVSLIAISFPKQLRQPRNVD
jgi:hypothetical protein